MDAARMALSAAVAANVAAAAARRAEARSLAKLLMRSAATNPALIATVVGFVARPRPQRRWLGGHVEKE
eukprot:gene22763-3930_t